MTFAAVRGQNCMRTPTLGSILLASTDPDRLRAWYERAFAARPNPDGFLEFGGVAVLIDHRDDIAASCVEPGRVILNLHVDDARAAAAHLATLGVRWVAGSSSGVTPGSRRCSTPTATACRSSS